MVLRVLLFGCLLLLSTESFSQVSKIDQKARSIEEKIIQWRRHFHQNPELGNREFKTAEKVADHLRQLGIEVQTGVENLGLLWR
jgi:metal-dependent amidase/aminoacylase/carboxypeptidase family protein